MIVVNGEFQFQGLYTGGSWAGVSGVDYEVIETHTDDDSLGVWREGIRIADAAYVIDTTLTATGFSGTEHVDWIQKFPVKDYGAWVDGAVWNDEEEWIE
jgi:hypothetical protein